MTRRPHTRERVTVSNIRRLTIFLEWTKQLYLRHSLNLQAPISILELNMAIEGLGQDASTIP
jgi:hypothetical protein